jgi:peptidoglycan/LPS O-acetylase OafA/YrhL
MQSQAAGSTRHRGDIDGLRAVAILAVVAFHVGIPGFSGGFVGVDVFFVISGYLITRNLVTETDQHDRPALLRFWARRVRRLVPALALMLATVLILALLVLPFPEWTTVAAQARSAALYVSNIAFAHQATNYFAPNVDTSLFLHTWSLGVEEQFYLVWPLLVTGVCALTRGRGARRRGGLVAVFAVTFSASLALCLVLTATGSPSAFFGLPARAWEFAAAGLLVLAPIPDRWRGGRTATVAAVVGLAAIAVAVVSFNQNANYPGWRALVPVGGALAVIFAGLAPSHPETTRARSTGPVSWALAVAPLQWVGRVSYSWYLWHWPFILLAVQATSRDTLGVRLAAAVVALGVATLAQAVVENPARFDPRLVASSRLTYSLGAAATAIVLVFSLGVDHAAVAAASGGPNTALAQIRASATDTACARPASTSTGIAYCQGGDLSSHRSVLLIGDSHAWHWIPAFDQAARVEGIKLLVRWHSLCPATPLPIVTLQDVRSTACDRFHRDTASLIDQLHPTAVVTSESNWAWSLLILPGLSSEPDRAGAWGQAYGQFLRSLRGSGIAVGSVVDTPRIPTSPVDCLAEHPAVRCQVPWRTALGPQHDVAVDQASVRRQIGHVPVLDVNGDLCSATTCRVVANGTDVYVDTDHLYRGFVLTEVPKVEALLTQLVPGR